MTVWIREHKVRPHGALTLLNLRLTRATNANWLRPSSETTGRQLHSSSLPISTPCTRMPAIDSRHTQIWSMTWCKTFFWRRSKDSRHSRVSRPCGRGWSPSRHKIEDIYRHRLRAAALALDVDSTEDEPASNEIPLDEQIDKARAGAKMRRVLERMPERYAFILLWRYWEQRSARDVAAAIGTTEKSVERPGGAAKWSRSASPMMILEVCPRSRRVRFPPRVRPREFGQDLSAAVWQRPANQHSPRR